MDREYMTTLDKTLARYFSLNGQKSVEGSITRVESALSFLSPAYLNDLVRVETGKALAGYVRVKNDGIHQEASQQGRLSIRADCQRVRSLQTTIVGYLISAGVRASVRRLSSDSRLQT